MKHVDPYRRPEAGTQPSHLHPAYVSSLKRAPARPLVAVPQTLTEVTGPVFSPELSLVFRLLSDT